jgi:predicted Ser/Thr protein kinase
VNAKSANDADPETPPSGGGTDADSLDALLREAARVSAPSAVAGRTLLPAGTALSGGRLSVLRRIGEGGMGAVYEAFDAERKARVALKMLSRFDASSVYRLKNEFRALADVTHANLCRLHELFAEGDTWFFTMELIDGERFDHWVRPEGMLNEARLRAALPELISAVSAIHTAGKLHRDLKPSNVLVARDGRVVVLDFGLAVDPDLGGVGQTVADDNVSGTPAYMAPEQAAGTPASPASDYYALGVMLFEALTGKLPFSGRTHEMLVDKQRSNAPSASTTSARAPHDLASLCDALLSREPKTRPDGKMLREMCGDLPHVSTGEPGHRGVSGMMPERELLLGREVELAALRAAYDATLAGQPVVLFVSGESGMGKSALVAHFLDELRAEGHAAVLAGRCYERESVPFKGIDSVVDDLSRFLRKLPATDASALMPREAYALARVFPVLGRLEAVARSPKKDIVDAQELRQRAFVAFGELLARIRDRRPLVLYVDDAQWFDRDAVTLLGYLLGQYEPAAALLVLSHRSEGAAGNPLLAQIHQHANDNARFQKSELSLGALPPAAAQELAARLLGRDGAARAAEVALEASGSPFFLGELSRQARRSVGGSRVTLHDAVLGHVQGLSASARRLLEVLAVAGRPLAIDVALDAAGASHEHIDVLHAERLLRGSGQERSLECYHDKIRESVAQALSAERQRAVHANLLAVLVPLDDADPEHLAIHAQGAGDRAGAARYAAQAAATASKAMAFEQAALLYGRALELGEHDENARRTLLTSLGEASANAGCGADAARAYLEAAAGATEDHALELKGRAAAQLLMSGHIDDGTALLGDVLRAVGLGLPRDPKTALLLLGWERARLKLRGLSFRERKDALPARERRKLDALLAGRALAGIDPLTGALLNSRYARLALSSGLPEHASTALAVEAWLASLERGPAAKAHAGGLLDRAEALAVALGRPEALAIPLIARCGAARNFGDAEAAKTYGEMAIKTLRERCTGVVFELGSARQMRQSACNALGDFAPAAELAALIDDAWRRGDLYAATMLTGSCAMARLVQGDVDGVQRHLERARQHWPRPHGYSHPDFHLLEAEVLNAIYTGEPQRSLEKLQGDWPAMEKALLLRRPDRRARLRAWRGGSALGVARLDNVDAPACRVLALGEARALARIRHPLAPAFSRTLQAGLALDEGNRAQAALHLRAALKSYEAIAVRPSIAAVQRRLGHLLGGDEGTALVAQADAALRAMGAVDLEATTRLLEVT